MAQPKIILIGIITAAEHLSFCEIQSVLQANRPMHEIYSKHSKKNSFI